MENAPDTSVLRVAVTTAVRTDRDGMTPPMTLAAPPRSASLAPGQVTPYALYTVEAMREGFVPLTALHVTLFAGVPAVLPVALTPLPEKE